MDEDLIAYASLISHLHVVSKYKCKKTLVNHDNLEDLWENMVMIDRNKQIVEKPTKEKYMELITPIFEKKVLEIIRTTRNELLTKSDWTQFVDVELDDKEEWKTYRQSLRDLPSNIEIDFVKKLDDYIPKSPDYVEPEVEPEPEVEKVEEVVDDKPELIV